MISTPQETGILGDSAELADIILYNAKVLTMVRTLSGEQDIQEAVAIKGRYICQVGSNDEVLKRQGPLYSTYRFSREDRSSGSHRRPLSSDPTRIFRK